MKKGQLLVEFGRNLVRPRNRVPDQLYQRLAGHFNPEQIVALTAFASLMVATNMINNILEVDLDEYLYEFREGQPLPKQVVEHGRRV
jgi:hypothetical protein